MILARVVGNVWASRKHSGLAGLKMLLVQPVTGEGTPYGAPRAAFDSVGCGPGELVYYVEQYEATLAFPERRLVPIDCAIVGIVDSLEDASAEVLAADGLGKAGV